MFMNKGTFKYHMTLQGEGGLLKPSECRHMAIEDNLKMLGKKSKYSKKLKTFSSKFDSLSMK